jgi:hypothetical protein
MSLAGAATAAAAPGLRVSIRRIELPDGDDSGSRALAPGLSGTMWVVGPREVLQLAPSSRVLENVAVPEGDDHEGRAVEATATATPDGGVSFFGGLEGHAESASPRLDHVSPAGVASSTLLPGLAGTPSSPLVAAADGGLWGVWSQVSPPGGALFRIDPVTYAIASYLTALEPYAIEDGPEDDFWIVGRSTNASGRLVVSLTTATGASVKTLPVPHSLYPLQDEVLTAAAPGGAVWIAVPGHVAYVSASGAISSFRLPYACESPYAITSGASGEALVLGTWPGRTLCRRTRAFAMQLTRISTDGHIASTALRLNDELATPLPAFADGKLWVLANDRRAPRISKPAVYVIALH